MLLFFFVVVRLVNGNSAREGHFEILYNGVWGTVCGYDWDKREANVVWRQLGYDGAVAATPWSAFGRTNRISEMNHIQCTGNESSISDCQFMRWKTGCGPHGFYKNPGAVCTQSGNSVAKHALIRPWDPNCHLRTNFICTMYFWRTVTDNNLLISADFIHWRVVCRYGSSVFLPREDRVL